MDKDVNLKAKNEMCVEKRSTHRQKTIHQKLKDSDLFFFALGLGSAF